MILKKGDTLYPFPDLYEWLDDLGTCLRHLLLLDLVVNNSSRSNRDNFGVVRKKTVKSWLFAYDYHVGRLFSYSRHDLSFDGKRSSQLFKANPRQVNSMLISFRLK